MTNWQSASGVVAGFLSIFCFLPYIVTILQGKTQPNRATWWIWVVLSTVISASYYSSGASNTIWLPICGGVGQLIIAILSLKYGKGGWSLFDRLCLLGVAISLLLWWKFNSPLIALLLNILIDFLGALPTIKKSYYEPQTENLLTWILYLVASILNLFAIEYWSFKLAAFPLYIFFINAIIVICLLRDKLKFIRKYNKHKKHRLFTKKKLISILHSLK